MQVRGGSHQQGTDPHACVHAAMTRARARSHGTWRSYHLRLNSLWSYPRADMDPGKWGVCVMQGVMGALVREPFGGYRGEA